MNGIPSGTLQPTWFGHVSTARDALILFEACLTGTLHHVPRRPHDRERSSLIKSGNVFIYEENASGIKRWTDGVPWSPSRILGNFLVYRELVKPFPPGEKKRAQKRPKNGRTTKPGEPYPRRASAEEQSPGITSRPDATTDSRDNERALIGSLVDSYGFKEGGLVKKTMSINFQGVHHHLVSYYKIEDVLGNTLPTPSKDPQFADVEPRNELVARQNFRAPLDDMDMPMPDPLANIPYDYGRSNYRPTPLLNSLGQQSQPQQLGIGTYGGTSFTTTSTIQPGLSSYAPIGQNAHSFFSATSSLPQTIVPKHESYAHFTNYSNNQNGQLSIAQDTSAQQHQNQTSHMFPYRNNSIGHIPSRLGSIGSATHLTDHKSLDSGDWSRNGNAYSTITSPLSAQSPFLSGTSQWSIPPSMNNSITRSEDPWVPLSATSSWPMTPGSEVSRQTTNFSMPAHSG